MLILHAFDLICHAVGYAVVVAAILVGIAAIILRQRYRYICASMLAYSGGDHE